MFSQNKPHVHYSSTSQQINAVIAADRAERAQRNRIGDAAYAIVELGYPRLLWGIWDFEANDTLRDENGATCRFTKEPVAQHSCDLLNARAGD